MKNASEKTRTEDMRTQQSNADVSLPDGMMLIDILYLLQAKLHVKEKLATRTISVGLIYPRTAKQSRQFIYVLCEIVPDP